MSSKSGSFIRRYRSNKVVIAVTLAVIILLVGGVVYFYRGRHYVPPEFLSARSKAAGTADEIVQLSNESAKNLETISKEDQAGHYTQGLDLVLQEVNRNTEIRDKAVQLSEELRIMAASLIKVKPAQAAKVGLQAVANDLELVQRLVNYNDYTYELLSVLQVRLKSNGSPATRAKIEQLIKKMDEETVMINNLNKRYQELMKEFDRLAAS